MVRLLRLKLGLARRFLRCRRDLLIENLVLRQQLSVLKRRNPRPKLPAIDKLFWVAVQRMWSGYEPNGSTLSLVSYTALTPLISGIIAQLIPDLDASWT